MKKLPALLAVFILCFIILKSAHPAYAQEPSLSLKDSIKIAEDALKRNNVDVSDHYLYSITFSRSSKGDYWYYTYRPKTASEYGQIFVKVYMNGEAEIV